MKFYFNIFYLLVSFGFIVRRSYFVIAFCYSTNIYEFHINIFPSVFKRKIGYPCSDHKLNYNFLSNRYSLFSATNSNTDVDIFQPTYSNDKLSDNHLEYEVSYIAGVGLESMIVSLGNRRQLLQIEYEMAFKLFPKLADLAIITLDNINSNSTFEKWPHRTELDEDDKIQHVPISNFELEAIQSEIFHSKYFESSSVDIEAERVLARFRKTILGVEKYRINNPGSISRHYNNMMRSCLRDKVISNENGWWSAAANALQYAGLNLREHFSQDTTKEGSMLLNLQSIWGQTLTRLLDIEVEGSTKSSITWYNSFLSE